MSKIDWAGLTTLDSSARVAPLNTLRLVQPQDLCVNEWPGFDELDIDGGLHRGSRLNRQSCHSHQEAARNQALAQCVHCSVDLPLVALDSIFFCRFTSVAGFFFAVSDLGSSRCSCARDTSRRERFLTGGGLSSGP